MSKYINAEKLIKILEKENGIAIKGTINAMPHIDIVWCKECIHNTGSSHNILCDLWYGTHYPNDFCSCGEREE